MKTITTLKTLKLKDMTEIPKGAKLEFLGASDMVTVGRFSFAGRELKLRYRAIIKNPSMRTMEKWSDDGIAKSVFGNKCEPDGYGEHGEPSWLLAIGII